MGAQPRVDLESLHFRSVPDALLGLRVDEAFDRGERYVHLEGSPVIFHDVGNEGYVCEGCGNYAQRVVQERKAVVGLLTGSPRKLSIGIELPYCPRCEDGPPKVSDEVLPFVTGGGDVRRSYSLWFGQVGQT